MADDAPGDASAADPTISSMQAAQPGPTEPANQRRRGPVADPSIRPDPQAAAFFDLDNTIIQGAALFHLAKGLYRRDFFPPRAILRGLWMQAYFRVTGKENTDHVHLARDSALSFITGHRVAEIAAAGEEIYEESIRRRIWQGTRALAQRHLDAGQPVWLVTAAPLEVATIIAERMGLTAALGTVPESIDGVYTGRLQGDLLHGEAKAAAVHRLTTSHGFDLGHCFAYSDSANDLPLLSLVGHPSAVNPDRRLTRHAQQMDWQIREFRTRRKAVQWGLLGAGAVGVAGGVFAAGAGMRQLSKR